MAKNLQDFIPPPDLPPPPADGAGPCPLSPTADPRRAPAPPSAAATPPPLARHSTSPMLPPKIPPPAAGIPPPVACPTIPPPSATPSRSSIPPPLSPQGAIPPPLSPTNSARKLNEVASAAKLPPPPSSPSLSANQRTVSSGALPPPPLAQGRGRGRGVPPPDRKMSATKLPPPPTTSPSPSPSPKAGRARGAPLNRPPVGRGRGRRLVPKDSPAAGAGSLPPPPLQPVQSQPLATVAGANPPLPAIPPPLAETKESPKSAASKPLHPGPLVQTDGQVQPPLPVAPSPGSEPGSAPVGSDGPPPPLPNAPLPEDSPLRDRKELKANDGDEGAREKKEKRRKEKGVHREGKRKKAHRQRSSQSVDSDESESDASSSRSTSRDVLSSETPRRESRGRKESVAEREKDKEQEKEKDKDKSDVPPTPGRHGSEAEGAGYDDLTSTIPFESLYNEPRRKRDPCSDIVSFPADNIVAESFEKNHRTEYSFKRSDEELSNLEPYVAVAYSCFSNPWKLVRLQYQDYTKWVPPSNVYELDVRDKYVQDEEELQTDSTAQETPRSGSGGGTNPALAKMASRLSNRPRSATYHGLQADTRGVGLSSSDLHFAFSSAEKRSRASETEENLPILAYYDPDYQWKPGTEIALCYRIRQTLRPDIKRIPAFRFRLTPKSLTFAFGDYEPFFCTACLYDFSQGLSTYYKISEDWNFDVNSNETNKHIQSFQEEPEHKLTIPSALFAVSDRNPKIYLVVKFWKVLHGSNEQAVEPYAKFLSAKDKEKQKLASKFKEEVEYTSRKMARHRQAVGWAASPLFDIKGNLIAARELTLDRAYAFNGKESLPDQLGASLSQDPKDQKRLGKEIGASMTFEVQRAKEESLRQFKIVDPSLQPLICPADAKHIPDNAEMLREIHEFPRAEQLVPNFHFVNNMYIYPMNVNLSKVNGKNIVCKMQVKHEDSEQSSPLKCIFANYAGSTTGFVSEMWTQVFYHNKTPVMTEEFKIVLPSKLTPKHHILFTFYHVNIATRKGKVQDEAEVPVAYAVLPLYQAGRMVSHNQGDHHTLPLTTKLEQGYLTPGTLHFIDGGKDMFKLRYDVHSTIYPQDTSINSLFETFYKSDASAEEELLAALRSIREDISDQLTIQYMPIIINMLLEIMNTHNGHKPAMEAFKSFVHILHRVKVKTRENVPRVTLLELYTNYAFDRTFRSRQSVHAALVSSFLLFLMEKKFAGPDTPDDSIYVNSWVIFDLIIKSMSLVLEQKGLLNADDRRHAFDDGFARMLIKLPNSLTKFFKSQMNTSNVEDVRILNRNLAMFIKDLFNIFDRGVTLDMMKMYLDEMTDHSNEALTCSFKYEFLRIVDDHEHYYALNLPFGIEDTDLTVETLSKRHPLAMLLIEEVISTLIEGDKEACTYAVAALYEIIVKTGFNSKLQGDRKKRVSAVWFVLLPMLVEHWNDTAPFRLQADKSNMRDLYVVVLHIIENTDRELLRHWWKQQELKHVYTFFNIIKDILSSFEFDPSVTCKATSLMTPQLALFMKAVGTDEMKNLLKGQQSLMHTKDDDIERLKRLGTQIDKMMLGLVEDLSEDFKEKIVQDKSPFMFRVVDSYIHMMKINSSDRFLHELYASLRFFLTEHAVIFFRKDNSFIGDLCQQVLRHCSRKQVDLNTQASSFLFFLCRLNLSTVGNFGRTRIQAITQLSKLVSSDDKLSEPFLKHAFTRLGDYALHQYSILPSTNSDTAYQMAQFSRAIQGLGATLANILRDTRRVKEVKKTAENAVIADLYWQIASGYRNLPDLRATWLEELAKFQASTANFQEAGMCMMHVAALVADYLISSQGYDIDRTIFSNILPAINEFADEGEEGVCQSSHFREHGFISAVKAAIDFFRRGEMFEYAAELFKLIIPLFERNHNYRELSSAFGRLHEMWGQVADNNEVRMLGVYFRMGFYGTAFGEELDGEEFVMKCPGGTHLFDFTEQLKKAWSAKTGQEIHTIDSSAKSTQGLDRRQCNIQLTHIEPYFDSGENRSTFFDRNVQISQFMYETPFTKGGKAHGSVAEQYKRKTILSVSESFPFAVCRLPVSHRREIIVSPLEGAVEAIEKRNLVVQKELDAVPPNPKTLQQVLQGSVRLQVNAGATEICKVFLGNCEQYPPLMVEQLANGLRSFLSRCEKLLALNKSLIKDEQALFQEEMETGYRELCQEMLPIIEAAEGKLNGTSASLHDGTDDNPSTHSHDDGSDDDSEMSDQQLTPDLRRRSQHRSISTTSEEESADISSNSSNSTATSDIASSDRGREANSSITPRTQKEKEKKKRNSKKPSSASLNDNKKRKKKAREDDA